MARKNTFGDQFTLFAAANLYNIDIQIVSTLRAGTKHVFHPSSSIPLATIYLGHFAENHVEHYVSLIPEFNNDTSTSNDHTSHVDVDEGGLNDDVGNVDNDASDVNNNTVDANNDDAGDVNNDKGDANNYACDVHNDLGDYHDDAGVIDSDVGDVDDITQPFLNNDELVIKITLLTFPFMRSNLKRVSRFFKVTMDNVPLPRVYIPELPEEQVVISIRKIIMLKGKCSGTVAEL